MNYLQSNNNRYRHHFCIFAKYRINMKREILYQKIAGTIAWQIKTGIWKAGEKLSSLRTISNEYGVSLNTAIQVYYELEKEGFIISRPKSGYIVNYKPLNLSAPATTQPSAQSPGKEEADSHDLNFDMMRVLDVFLNIYRIIAKRGPCFGL